jgi:hypothetical protein
MDISSYTSETMMDDDKKLVISRTFPKDTTIYKGKVVFFYNVNECIYFLLGREVGGNTADPLDINSLNILGGTREQGESIAECAAREMYEETLGIFNKTALVTCLENLPSKNVIVYSRTKKDFNAKTLQKIFVFFVPFSTELLSTQLSRCFHPKNIEEEFKHRCGLYALNKVGFARDYLETTTVTTTTTKPVRSKSRWCSCQKWDHFTEISELKWVEIGNMEKKVINRVFYNRIQRIKTQGIVYASFKEYVLDILLKN